MGEPEYDRAQLTRVVDQAQRRVRANHVLREVAWAGSITLLGPVGLLLAGTQWFTRPLLLLFVAAGAGFAVWRLWKRRPTAYQVSQVLDVRLAASDQISTAVYFLDADSVAATEQRHTAARIAAVSPVAAAFPVTVPRSLYALAGVVAVVSALWAVRFLLEKPFRLEQPLPRVIQQALNHGRPPDQDRDAQQQPEQLLAKGPARTVPYENQDLTGIERRAGEDPSAPTAQAVVDPEDGRKSEAGRGSEDGAQTGDPFGDPVASNDPDDMPISSYEDMLERDAKSGLSKPDAKQGNDKDSNSDARQSGDAESNSLLSKLREAMNNMLSRLQQKNPSVGKQQQAAAGSPSNQGEQQEGKGEGQNGQGQPQPGGQQAGEGEGGDSDQQQPGAAGAAAKAGAKSSEGGQKGNSGEGAGQQEGDKAILDAQQQEALGKLSELYGRRAAQVSGEVTVEAQPGKQSLRTPQSAKQGAHSDAGGQVSRDEIPLAYQAYIKEYFSKIRQTEKK